MRLTIYDPLRKKELVCTPEEKVRQAIIAWLNEDLGFPLSLMSSEYAFEYNSLSYRADIVVFSRELKPIILVECKAPSLKLTREVLEQGLRYNRVLKVKYMIFSNGVTTRAFIFNEQSQKYEALRSVPSYEEILKINPRRY